MHLHLACFVSSLRYCCNHYVVTSALDIQCKTKSSQNNSHSHRSTQLNANHATLCNFTQLIRHNTTFLLGSLFSDVGATQVPKSYIVLCFRCVNQIHLDTTGFNCLHQRRGRDSELLKPVRFIQIWHEITGRVKIVWSKVGPLFSSTNVKKNTKNSSN